MGEVIIPEADANWRSPDTLWECVEPLLPTEAPTSKGGRPRAPARPWTSYSRVGRVEVNGWK